MNTATMRRIDHALGSPMCAALTAIRRATEPTRPAPPDPPQRILVVKLAEQGAWIVADSAIRDAIAMVGADNVFLMTFADNRPVLDELRLVPDRNVIEVRTTGPVRTILDLLRAVRRARRERVDVALDFEFFARSSAVLCYLSGASRRVGFHASWREASYRGDLHTHRLSYNPRMHVGDLFRLIVHTIDADPAQLPAVPERVPPADPPPPIEFSLAERDEVAGIVRARLGRPADIELPPLVVLNANAGDLLPLRRWPSERYVDLANRLLAADPDVAIVMTGGASEAAATDEVAAAVGSERCVSVAGRTTLRQLLVLYELSQVLVTNDSGPAHYAAVTGVDIVTLFGPESPHVFGSLSPRNHPIWAELPCSPCVNAYNDRKSACHDNVCMQEITVDEVEAKVVELRAARRRQAAPAGRLTEAPRA